MANFPIGENDMKISDAIAIAFIAFCVATPASASGTAKFILFLLPGRIAKSDANFLEGMIGAILGAIAGGILGNTIDFKPWVLAVIGAIIGAAWLGT